MVVDEPECELTDPKTYRYTIVNYSTRCVYIPTSHKHDDW
jgi:hypothetical protein